MTTARIIAIAAAAACSIPAGFALFNVTRCAPLNEGAKARLVDYVRKKYNLPLDAGLKLSDASLVGSTCYRKLEFKSQGSARAFHISLFATPDLKYLTRELLDTGASPAAAAPQAQRELAGVANGDFPSLGPANAPVTVAVFSDFECPFCARFAAMMRKEVLPAEAQHVRLVYRQFPLPMHPWARAAAEASICAYQQNHDYFWSFHDFFFEHQHELTADNLRAKILEHASAISGLDRAKFEGCLSEGGSKTAVDRELAFGNDNGIHATPTVFINGKQAQVGDSGQMLALVRQLEKDPNAPIPSPAPAATAKARRTQPRAHEIADVAKGNFPTLGPANAAVTLTVFSDFQCPYCAKFADMMRRGVLPVAGANVRLVYRYFPLSMHAWARASAEAAACAYQQKNEYFWSFHDFFFDHQKDLTPANLRQQILDHARTIGGLDQARFQKCVEQDGGRALVEREVAFGNANGIEATPTVFLNGQETEAVAPEQLLTLIRELGPSPAAPARARASAPGAEQ